MGDLEHQWQYQEQTGPEPDECQAPPGFDMANEVIAQLRQRAASRAASRTYHNDDAGQSVPGRTGDLTAYLTDCQIGGDNAQSSEPFSTSAANVALQDQITGRAGVQSNGSPGADVQPSNPDARTLDVRPQFAEIPGLRQEMV